MMAKFCALAAPELADRRPEWLNVGDGTVDLRTMLIKPHDPADMITYCVDTAWNPAARGSGWDQLTWHVAGENQAIWRYLIKMLGYSLLGDNREQLVFFLTGPTASGKSQVLETVAKVIGPQLAHSSSGDLIGRTIGRTRHPRTEASLVGKRFVYIDESAERISVDEGQLKRLTGASQVSVNMLYRDTESDVPVTWAIWLATNELPTVTGFDDAIRRRLRAIPCGSTIPEEYRIKGLADSLAEREADAILACLIWGAHAYLTEGEQCPVEVHLATAEYEAEQDTAARFREECCQDIPAYLNGGHPQATLMSEIRREYVAWCQATRTPMLPPHAFGKAFRELPGIQYDPNQKRVLGLTLIRNYQQTRQDDHP
jgi:putative DNA primase/helicase